MKKLFFYSAIAMFAASCASQKYSRTDNITDDVYFSPSSVENQVAEEPEEAEQDGFHYDTESNTPNPNASYYRYQAGGSNTTYQTNVPDSTQSVNYSNPTYTNITNDYYGNAYNQGAFGYTGWGMSAGFGCQPGFGMLYSPYSGWGWGVSYSYSPYGFYSPYGGCYNPWGSPYGYNPYYGYYPYSAYNPWYGYTPGYGYYNPYGTNPYQYTTGSGSSYTNQPRISRSTVLPSTLYGSGTGRGRAATTTDPLKPVYRPYDENQPNTNPPVLRGTDGTPGVRPQDGNPVQRTNPAIQPQRPEAKPNPNPTPQPQRPEIRPPAPQPQRPEARPNPNPTPRPQAPAPQTPPAPRSPDINPSPSPSPSPSRPSGNGGATPQRRR